MNMKNSILLIGSLVFYTIGAIHNPEHICVLLISIILDFEIAIQMENRQAYKKQFLALGIIYHLASLVFFKYSNFLVGEINKIITNELSFNILLPIGISFYTFQGLSYLIDVYKGKIRAEKSLLRYSVYISMFEQLIAGPIVTYSEIRKELYRKNLSKDIVINGIQTFVFGLGLKVLLANPLSKIFTQVQNIGFESISTPLAWLAIIAFSLQIYFDFFGYSLMAIGLGKMLGFTIPKNFDFPYLSHSMSEFWRKWHITLGSWFREYIYIPLGGNKHSIARTILNLLVVWLLTGIWHGAGYNFILWGFVLFLIIAIEKLFLGKFLDKHKIFGRFYMMLLIPISWSIFAIDDMGELKIFLSRLFPFASLNFSGAFSGDFKKYLIQYLPFIIVGLLLCSKKIFEKLKNIKNKYVVNGLLLIIFLGCVYCMYKGFDDPFLYFRF